MIKAFWEGFRTGFITTIKIGLTPSLFLVAGLLIGYNSHPYESCSREHVGGDNIGECVWLKLQGRE